MIRVARWLAVPAVAAALTTAVQDGPVDAPPGHVVIRDGHVDLGPRFPGGTWTIEMRDDTGGEPVWRRLDDVVLHAGEDTRTEVPPGDEYAFLGAPGSAVWLLPQTERAGTVWPGWNTQDPGTAARVDREVTWRLRSVQGPGPFSLFLTGAFGAPQVVFDGRNPLPQETGIEVGSHVHGNWAFGAPGTYLLGIEMSASTVDGEQVADRQVLRVHVGDGDPAGAFAVASTAVPETSADEDSDSSPVWWIAGAVVVAGVVVLAVVWRRTRRTLGS
ncbi:choice-of-anchor M domain-containing protein [Amycolatopsis jiangsuensis]|uniref:Putative ABC transporter-associated repeat protein n=1 Tax=Amycolatopsis jiangsuensis TaxID=1181879 RepID=A0A840J646_9PSEU|nr:choice-of-anchor M domain-containing protein [Amycolatopsis jiangsuensis]MBB4689253.1 putative ABC transporter-associated repeat protein [Amycolatopsis jiangsuensis]